MSDDEDTEVQFTDTFQRAVIEQLNRQTLALESIRYVLWFCFALGIISGVLAVIIIASGQLSGGL